VAVSKLLLTPVALRQQLLECWGLSRFRSSSLRRVYVDYYFYVGLDCAGLCACCCPIVLCVIIKWWWAFSVSGVIDSRLETVIVTTF